MLITQDELKQFSGTYPEESDTQSEITDTVINAAGEIIKHYLCFDCEEKSTNNTFYDEDTDTVTIPQDVKFVCYEISTLLQMEQSNNIGINNKSFDVSGSRSFLNVVDYSKYLARISAYRKVVI